MGRSSFVVARSHDKPRHKHRRSRRQSSHSGLVGDGRRYTSSSIDEIERSLPHFLVNPPLVFTDDSDRNKLNATKKQ